MKKLYLDPDFEVLNIRLCLDVLGDSDETDIGIGGETVPGDQEFEDIL